MSIQGGKMEGKVRWRSPSNIAIVKYWGKAGHQQPLNPSLSMTLSKSHTTTTVSFTSRNRGKGISLEFLFNGQRKPAFENKIRKYLEFLESGLPFLSKTHLYIESSNSFPHSAGIASSASSMSALALCLLSVAQRVQEVPRNEYFLREASYYARIGSGSACRSLFPGWAIWGETAFLTTSSQLHATGIEKMVHPSLRNLHDSIMIVESSEKSISSSRGHELMNEHPFRVQRQKQAGKNLEEALQALQTGNFRVFSEVTESEAYCLHSLLKSSRPGYVLTTENTLHIIEKMQDFRNKEGIEICFTLDAGPNVHLLYPPKERVKVLEWIKNDVLRFCQNGKWIDDKTGEGPQMLVNE